MATHPGRLKREATPFQDASYDYSLEEAKEMLGRINVPRGGLLGNGGQSEVAILRDVCSMLIEHLQVVEGPPDPDGPHAYELSGPEEAARKFGAQLEREAKETSQLATTLLEHPDFVKAIGAWHQTRYPYCADEGCCLADLMTKIGVLRGD